MDTFLKFSSAQTVKNKYKRIYLFNDNFEYVTWIYIFPNSTEKVCMMHAVYITRVSSRWEQWTVIFGFFSYL